MRASRLESGGAVLATGLLAGAPGTATSTSAPTGAEPAEQKEQRTRPTTTTRVDSPTPSGSSRETAVSEMELDEVGFENFSQEEAEVDVWNILGLN
jgi:hypothetical protein